MSNATLNSRFDIPLESLEETIRHKINGNLTGYNSIIPLRDLSEVHEVLDFNQKVFTSLIRKIPLRSSSGEKIYPYEESNIRVFELDPKALKIGQRFVLESKLLSLMSSFSRGPLSEFILGGISRMPPKKVYGIDKEGRKVMAFYIPPFVERHNESAVLIDGIHRSYICGSSGSTINLVYIKNINSPLPFSPIEWKETKLCNEKPPIDQRYDSLNKEFFRDLGAVGIDG